jgi:hypothetical protein
MKWSYLCPINELTMKTINEHDETLANLVDVQTICLYLHELDVAI